MHTHILLFGSKFHIIVAMYVQMLDICIENIENIWYFRKYHDIFQPWSQPAMLHQLSMLVRSCHTHFCTVWQYLARPAVALLITSEAVGELVWCDYTKVCDTVHLSKLMYCIFSSRCPTSSEVHKWRGRLVRRSNPSTLNNWSPRLVQVVDTTDG